MRDESGDFQGWAYYTVSLDKYKGNENIIIGFKGYIENFLVIDNISVVKVPATDLAVTSVDTYEVMVAGEYANILQTRAESMSEQPVSGYSVELYKKRGIFG